MWNRILSLRYTTLIIGTFIMLMNLYSIMGYLGKEVPIIQATSPALILMIQTIEETLINQETSEDITLTFVLGKCKIEVIKIIILIIKYEITQS